MPTSSPVTIPAAASPPPRRLLDQVRDAVRVRHYSYRTERAYVGWIRRFLLFHDKRHPAEMGADEIRHFLTALAVQRHVSASTQNQALAGLLFLYREVLGRDPGWIDDVVRAKRTERLPIVLTRGEIGRLFAHLDGATWILAARLYGGGLRLMEGLRLRVHDLDFERGEILIRHGKGGRDRVSVLPTIAAAPLTDHLDHVRTRHAADRAAGLGMVRLPDALARKYPNAAGEWGWQWVFPAARICTDPRFGPPTRYHLHESAVQMAVHGAARRAGLA